MDKSLPKKLHPYSYWGISFDDSNGSEHIATCPFCNSEDLFFCNAKSGAFDCKRCGKQGSWRDFLEYIHKTNLKKTTEEDLLTFVKAKGVPLPVLKRWEMAKYKDIFFFPVYDLEEKVVDLRRFKDFGKENRTAGSETILLGIKQLLNKSRKDEVIYICEGSLDAFCLDWLLRRLSKPGIVLAVPGANSFRADWAHYFERRKVVLCYDNDESGYGTIDEEKNKASGSLKAAAFISAFTKDIKYIVWPDTYREKYDVKNLIQDNKKKPSKCLRLFNSFISPNHKYADSCTTLGADSDSKDNEEIITITLKDVLEETKKNFKVNKEMEVGIKLSLAVAISQNMPGDVNPWLFLVGPPGTGKTLILGMFEDCNQIIWESTLSAKALISGFGLGANTLIDPSILSKVNGKCLVLKDFTEVIHKSEIEMNEVFSILRGAFDGRVRRPYGTGTREYICDFTILAGVTNIINAFGSTSLGERFLKYNVFTKYASIAEEEAVQESAVTSQLIGGSSKEILHALVTKFLRKKYDFSGENLIGKRPRWFTDQVKPLANLVAFVRTTVKHYEKGEMYGHQVFSPVRESGNRLTIQFEKVAIILALIEEKEQIDKEIYEIIKLVAAHTAQGFKFDIVKFLIKHKEATEIEIKEGLQTKAVSGYLSELQQLKIVSMHIEEIKQNRSTRKVIKYSLTKVIIDLWNRAKL